MPIAQQFITRALASGPGDVAFDASIGAAQTALGGGSMGAVMSAAGDAGLSSMEEIKSDLPQFACGALRLAMERTPIFGPVFRLGEAALGKRMCEKDEMTVAERQSLARGAAVDFVAPGASVALSAVEMGASKTARPILEALAPGLTQSSGYKSYASFLRADDPTRAEELAAKKERESVIAAAPSAPAEPAAAKVEQAIEIEAPSMMAEGSMADRLAARRAAKLASAPMASAPSRPSMMAGARM